MRFSSRFISTVSKEIPQQKHKDKMIFHGNEKNRLSKSEFRCNERKLHDNREYPELQFRGILGFFSFNLRRLRLSFMVVYRRFKRLNHDQRPLLSTPNGASQSFTSLDIFSKVPRNSKASKSSNRRKARKKLSSN